jgi:hypothetical protein
MTQSHGPTPELMVPLADQPGEIGLCVFTKGKRVGITLRGEPFPHLLAALDRLVHHGHIVGIKGDSYRQKAAAAWVSSDAPGPCRHRA